jgi:3alpha(or 20beta)-hydroxysteroid dehydrogenase
MDRLAGKVALISGGAGGIGSATVRRFVAEGARVVIADVAGGRATELAGECGDDAVACQLDVTDPSSWDAAVSATLGAYGALDVLVNNAGIARFGSIEGLPLEIYQQIVDVNQTGVWLGMRAAIPALRAAGGGSIVNMSSVAGMGGTAKNGAYSATKWAVRGMTKVAAVELAGDHIRVNSVHPGLVATNLVSDAPEARASIDAFAADKPIPRAALPDEIALLLVYLASDESAFCTGAEFVIDGGSTAGPARGPMSAAIDAAAARAAGRRPLD